MQTLKGNKIKLLSRDNQDFKQVLLDNRGISLENEQKYFNPKFEDLLDPFLFNGMDKAVDRIIKAIENKERIVVFGDYDVDGVSSTAMMSKFLAEIGAQVSYRLPHRANDGYGLKDYFINELHSLDVKLLITVDCGTRDVDVVNLCGRLGIDVIITDHHNVPEVFPESIIALLNPKLEDSPYPNKDLSGSGVAFKLLHAIASKIIKPDNLEKTLKKYIDFAMLGTISDCMLLQKENRTIAYLGLKQLKNSHSPGLMKLIEGEDMSKLDANLVGFKIGPRLNAAGRMDTPYKALRFLLASESNLDEALSEIEFLNEKRKTATEKFAREAKLAVDGNSPVIFFDSKEIEHGIIGLIAGRLAEAHNKIAVVLKDEGTKLVASLRGPEYLNIVAILEEMKELFDFYGGHNQAAGFTIQKKNFSEFKKRFTEVARRNSHNIDIQKELKIDMELQLDKIDFASLKLIENMMPFGIGNDKPLFLSRNISFDEIRFIGKDNKHLKLIIKSSKLEFKAFSFGENYKTLLSCPKIAIIYEIERNIWNGKESISLNIKDFLI